MFEVFVFLFVSRNSAILCFFLISFFCPFFLADKMQQELISSTNGGRLMPAIESGSFGPLDQRLCSPPYLTNGGDLFYPYTSIFSNPEGAPSPLTHFPVPSSLSLSPSSASFDGDDDLAATDNRLYLARLTLQYQEIADRYELCLSHLHEAAEEAEALRHENVKLRIANGELTKRLAFLSVNQNSRIPSSAISAAANSLAEEFRRLGIGEPTAEMSPTSVLEEEKRVSLPKSISIRSSGYLKLNPTGVPGTTSNRSGRLRVSSPAVVGSQKVYVGGKKEERGEAKAVDGDEEGALEFEVYNQGMFKTELCNKWEETGECPYGDHCQFAHGIAELRPVIRHPRYKTEVCRMVLAGDTCPYGHRCHFRHTLAPSDRLLLRP
ncbi:zinc finger CCCH domain-containing protein 9-like isoform X2 [Typha latifolia]|uniref:zinc finger CCCH domain-containing protein 9-like isoform X2 n=2 Tax=Typha latifolia TaxID=4733 RepID=UPI003C2ACB4E